MNHKGGGLGVLGLGSRSTLFYIQQLNAIYQQRKGGYSTCPFILINADFNEINPHLPNRFDQLEGPLKLLFLRFESCNLTTVLVPNITLHEAIDRMKPRLNIVHPVHLAIEQLTRSNVHKVVVFGSIYSMGSSYLTAQFSGAGIELLAPKGADKIQLDAFRKKVYAGRETARDIDQFQALLAMYATRQKVLIACTELSLFVPDTFTNICDMATLQIEQAVKLLID